MQMCPKRLNNSKRPPSVWPAWNKPSKNCKKCWTDRPKTNSCTWEKPKSTKKCSESKSKWIPILSQKSSSSGTFRVNTSPWNNKSAGSFFNLNRSETPNSNTPSWSKNINILSRSIKNSKKVFVSLKPKINRAKPWFKNSKRKLIKSQKKKSQLKKKSLPFSHKKKKDKARLKPSKWNSKTNALKSKSKGNDTLQ
jgi:hypothetical protein